MAKGGKWLEEWTVTPASSNPGRTYKIGTLHADDGCHYEMDLHRALRIAACVNACAGVPTKELVWKANIESTLRKNAARISRKRVTK